MMPLRSLPVIPALFLILLVVMLSCSPQHSLFSDNFIIQTDRQRVLKAADSLLAEPPITVTDTLCPRSSGGRHDYYSEGDYWWPDPDNPQGPYIRRDGLTNPGNFTAHRKAMRRLSIIAPTLTAAFKITGDQRYADHALKHLKAWFIAPETRMNPHLLYSQAIKGRVSGRGIGIIDTIHLVEVARAIEVLDQLGYLMNRDARDLRRWFADYLQWITRHPYGQKERDNGNNHSTCWAMQVAEFARLTGNTALLDSIRTFYRAELLKQMAADGSFPRELARTKPYGYSLFNLDAMAMVCQIASSDQENLWNYTTPDGRGMRRAMEFMFPYIKDKTTWPYQPDVMYFDQWPVRQPALLFAGRAFGQSKYIQLWRVLEADPAQEEIIRNYFIRQPILWVGK